MRGRELEAAELGRRGLDCQTAMPSVRRDHLLAWAAPAEHNSVSKWLALSSLLT